jgi:hypothetical protein
MFSVAARCCHSIEIADLIIYPLALKNLLLL